jgi:hypothetical protein
MPVVETQLVSRDMVKKIRSTGKKMGSNERVTSTVLCSSCGAVVRSSAQVEEEQMCLICHARSLNDYFQNLRRKSDEKRNSHHVASE